MATCHLCGNRLWMKGFWCLWILMPYWPFSLSLTSGLYLFLANDLICFCNGASGRVLPPVTGRSRVRVAVSSHCTSEGKACHWHPSPDPAQSGSSLHWVRKKFQRISNLLNRDNWSVLQVWTKHNWSWPGWVQVFFYFSYLYIYNTIIAIESLGDIWDHRSRYWFKILSDHLPDLVDKVWCCSCKDICIVRLCFIHDNVLKKVCKCRSHSLTTIIKPSKTGFPVFANLIRCISLSFRIRL